MKPIITLASLFLLTSFASASTQGYLQFSNENHAWARVDQMGKDRGLAFWDQWFDGSGSRMFRRPSQDKLYIGTTNEWNELNTSERNSIIPSGNLGSSSKPNSYGYSGTQIEILTSNDGGNSFNSLGSGTMEEWTAFSRSDTGVTVSVYLSWAELNVNNSSIDIVRIKNLQSPNSSQSELASPYVWGTIDGTSESGYSTSLESQIEINGFDVDIDVSNINTANFTVLLGEDTQLVPEPSAYALLIGGLALSSILLRPRNKA